MITERFDERKRSAHGGQFTSGGILPDKIGRLRRHKIRIMFSPPPTFLRDARGLRIKSIDGDNGVFIDQRFDVLEGKTLGDQLIVFANEIPQTKVGRADVVHFPLLIQAEQSK